MHIHFRKLLLNIYYRMSVLFFLIGDGCSTWGTYEPNGQNEHCMIRYKDVGRYYWADIDCNDTTSNSYVCEYEPQQFNKRNE